MGVHCFYKFCKFLINLHSDCGGLTSKKVIQRFLLAMDDSDETICDDVDDPTILSQSQVSPSIIAR